MNILYIAYSCSPHKGSEEKIGWNVPFECAKHHNVYVVTKEEHRETIEEYVRANNVTNPKFYFVDINSFYKKIFKGIMYSVRLNIWHKNALPVVNDICKNENIDIVHQITPIEFRSIGNYAKIDNVKFVCGPMGGGEPLPKQLKKYAKGNMFIEYARNLMNIWGRFQLKITRKLDKCSFLLFTNFETKDYLSKLIKNIPVKVMPEIGVSSEEIIPSYNCDKDKDVTNILVAGRLVYRKGHSLLLDALNNMPADIRYNCRIVGDGPEKSSLVNKCKAYGIENNVTFTGRLPFESMSDEYKNADIFIMPSIREATGTVLIEAMSKGIPIITINKFGGSVLLDNSCACLYSGNSTDEYIHNLKDSIVSMAQDSKRREQFSANLVNKAELHTWQSKIDFYISIYHSIFN